MARPRAIGYLRRDVSGVRQDWHEIRIRSLASRFGYDLCKTLIFGPGTERPVDRLRTAVERTRATAIFVPGTSHFEGDVVPAALLMCADVIAVDTEKVHTRIGPAYTARLRNLLDSAWAIAGASGQMRIGVEHILLALLRSPGAIGPADIRATAGSASFTWFGEHTGTAAAPFPDRGR